MIEPIEENSQAVAKLCRKFRVQRLELFGSAAGGPFDPQLSDLDFLVEFEKLEQGEVADAYFGLLEGLRDLFHRNIDLVMLSAVKNPYFLQKIEGTRTLLYAA